MFSAIKTSELSQLANREDFTWATYNIFTWNTAELFLIIFCGTLPTLKPIMDLAMRIGLWARHETSQQSSAPGFRFSAVSRKQENKGGNESDTEGILMVRPANKYDHIDPSIRTTDSGHS